MFFLKEEHPLGIQIYGGEEFSMEGAARIAESMNRALLTLTADAGSRTWRCAVLELAF